MYGFGPVWGLELSDKGLENHGDPGTPLEVSVFENQSLFSGALGLLATTCCTDLRFS